MHNACVSTVDSKTVSHAIRATIRPVLRAAGFSAFTGRNGWRYADDRIDVVNFQSFSAYNASVLGCTSHSFSVNLGCHLAWLPGPSSGALKDVGGRPRPQEYECPFRGMLFRRFSQPELERRSIWYVDPAGECLTQSMEDVRGLLSSEGMTWFDAFADPVAVLQLLQNAEPSDALWGFGRNPSPMRHYLIGYAALHVGDSGLAREHLTAALASGCFGHATEGLQRDIDTTHS